MLYSTPVHYSILFICLFHELKSMFFKLTFFCLQAQKFRNLKTVDLITKLVSLLVQIRSLSEHEESTYDCSSIQESLHELKSSIHSSNVQ